MVVAGDKPCVFCRAPRRKCEEKAGHIFQPVTLRDVALLRGGKATVMKDEEPNHACLLIEPQHESERSHRVCAEQGTRVGGSLGNQLPPLLLHFHGQHHPLGRFPQWWPPVEGFLTESQYPLSARNIWLEGGCAIDTVSHRPPINGELEFIVLPFVADGKPLSFVKSPMTHFDASRQELGQSGIRSLFG